MIYIQVYWLNTTRCMVILDVFKHLTRLLELKLKEGCVQAGPGMLLKCCGGFCDAT
jgi:hypothetical protein